MELFTGQQLEKDVPMKDAIVNQLKKNFPNISNIPATLKGLANDEDMQKKIQYQADTRMEVKSIAAWEQKDRQIGQAINWRILCSSMGPPGGECQSWIRYGHGIDKIQELIILGQDLGMIGKAGAWLTCEFMASHLDLVKEINPEVNTEDMEAVLKSVKVQGQEKLYQFLTKHPKVVEILEDEIKGML